MPTSEAAPARARAAGECAAGESAARESAAGKASARWPTRHSTGAFVSHRRGSAAVALALAALVTVTAGACGGGPGRGSARTPAASASPGGTTGTGTAPPATATPAQSAGPSATPLPAPGGSAASPVFLASATPLDAATRARMTGVSWRPGCPVAFVGLRLLRLTYWGFDGHAHQGELVVNADAVAPVRSAFRALFADRFPVRRMSTVEAYGGDDERSMRADNTSAFNCRLVPGTKVWSQHAYGRAVDLNPLENPEVSNGAVDPPAAAPWADRSRSDPGMIRHGDAAWQAFTAVGWTWGGDWSAPSDYMHFSANGL